MSSQPAAIADELVEVPAALPILFNLPQELQTVAVLRALICAEHAGCLRAQRELASSVLANISLSSSRPS